MNATSLAVSVQSTAGVIVCVDLPENVFQLCVADAAWRPVESQRLSRAQFERWFANRAVSRVVMEACGSAHHWARWLAGLGIAVTLLPARYVRAYVKRNKTDAADAAALLEAARCADLQPGAHQERGAAFLTYLAVQRNVAASTQNQAKSALLFLYRVVLGCSCRGWTRSSARRARGGCPWS